jgi:hypothetical protein
VYAFCLHFLPALLAWTLVTTAAGMSAIIAQARLSHTSVHDLPKCLVAAAAAAAAAGNLLQQTLKGHGKEINDINVHPQHPHIILSASKVRGA